MRRVLLIPILLVAGQVSGPPAGVTASLTSKPLSACHRRYAKPTPARSPIVCQPQTRRFTSRRFRTPERASRLNSTSTNPVTPRRASNRGAVAATSGSSTLST